MRAARGCTGRPAAHQPAIHGSPSPLTCPPAARTARRYALDVNISSLDVLNHKRLLDSARADPSAVSFQLRPVDVVTGSDLARRPSFGSLDTLQLQAHEVRARRSTRRARGLAQPGGSWRARRRALAAGGARWRSMCCRR